MFDELRGSPLPSATISNLKRHLLVEPRRVSSFVRQRPKWFRIVFLLIDIAHQNDNFF